MKLLSLLCLFFLLVGSSLANDLHNTSETAAMFYIKIPFTNNKKTMKQQQRIGFSLSYLASNPSLKQHPQHPIIDISFTENQQTLMQVNGIEIYKNQPMLNNEECPKTECNEKTTNSTFSPGYIAASLIGAALFFNYMSDKTSEKLSEELTP